MTATRHCDSFAIHQNHKIMKKQTGIWLDSKEANFIELVDGDLVKFRKLDAGHQRGNAKGGAHGGGRQGGTAAGVSEKTFENRRRNEEQEYYEEVLGKIGDADEVIIFGPGEAKDHLVNTIKTHRSHFKSDLMAVFTADKMTKNQKVAYVKTFFVES